MQEIVWREVPFAAGWEDEEPDAVVWIDIKRIDAAWALTDQYIVPGGANGQDSRYQKVGEWFAGNRHCAMPFASFCEIGFQFTDGRHRFAWLRDQGVETMPFQVPPSEATFFKEHFGSKFRRTIL
ncbi:hypothetical protein [Sphingopyxis sp. JAI128]|uniref:hypothetical protein n=1 Tax=Sphingopyxis sp. JAI128 TaxID=2723066 RepID=UPI00160C1386|nr:hypothetical protein [Sphingopyxis sp. JAI128]MBB6428150.1 hypothetical protein [Sphingopyxis sp. JAI128]